MTEKVISLFLSLIMFVSAVVCADLSAYAASSEEEYQTYLADYLLDNPVAQDYLDGKQALPYRMYVEQRRYNPAFNSLLTAWRIGTFSLSDVTKYADKEVGYYQAILFDILLTDDNSSSLFDDIDNLTDSINASSFKKIYNLYSEIMDPSASKLDVNSQEYKNFMKASKELKGLSEAFNLIDNFDKYYSYCKNSADFIKKCSQVQAVAVNYTMLEDILTDISNKTNNPALKIACTNMRGIIESAINTLLVENIFILGKGVKILADDILGTIWDSVIESCIGYGYAIKAGQAMGKLVSNLLFATEKDLEHVYAMYALYDFEDLLTDCVKTYQSSYKSSRTIQNAYKYNEAFKLFLKVQLEGADYSREFVRICCDEGLLNNVYKYFNQDDYNTFMQYILNAEYIIKNYIYFINTNIYNSFIDIYRANTDSNILNAVYADRKTQSISQKQYNESVQYIKALSTQYYGLNFTESTVLTDDIITYSDCFISANVDLNGHTMTVNGDLLHSEGILNIGTGTLNIKGNYRIAKKSIDEYGKITYRSASAYLNMNNDDGLINIDGDFITQSYDFYYGSSDNVLTAGTVIIGGDFYQYNDPDDSRYCANFPSKEAHKVIFKGDRIHKIYFEEEIYSYFSNLETFDNAKIQFTGKLRGFTLTQDLNVEGDMELSNGTLNLNGHTMTVNGDLLHSEGILNIGTGTLNIKGNYRIAKKSIDEYGKITYHSASAYLNMNNNDGLINIDGDFITQSYNFYGSSIQTGDNVLTAGTVIIGGDFYQYNDPDDSRYCANFPSKEEHKVIFKGNRIHKIYFEEETYSYFSNLETFDNAKIQFTGKLRGFTLTQDLNVEGDMELSNGTLNLNGHTMTVNGDFTIKSDIDINVGVLTVTENVFHSGGNLYIHNGSLNFLKDYRQQIKSVDNEGNVTYSSSDGYISMTNLNDQMNVFGNMYIWGKKSSLSNGTLYLSGNLTDYNGNARFSDKHRTVLSGMEKQEITFSSTYSKFNILQLTKDKINYEFSPENCWVTLIEVDCKHNYKNGFCTVCGEKDPNYEQPSQNPSNNTSENPSQNPINKSNKSSATKSPNTNIKSKSTLTTSTSPTAIKKAKVKNLKVKAKGKKITVSWKKIKIAKGYQVQVATNKKFKKKKIVFDKNTKKKKLIITSSKIKRKKTYYVRVRAYAKINGKKVNGKWSKKIRVKIK